MQATVSNAQKIFFSDGFRRIALLLIPLQDNVFFISFLPHLRLSKQPPVKPITSNKYHLETQQRLISENISWDMQTRIHPLTIEKGDGGFN